MNDVNKRLLKSAHKAAKALNRVGAMDDVTLRELEALCLPPVRLYTPNQIQEIRSSIGMSQPVFARLMGVGKSSIAQWEQGEKKPSGPALRLLEAFDKTAQSPVDEVRERQNMRSRKVLQTA